MKIIENIEVLIITSKVKYVPEFDKDILCNSLQTEDINFIPKMISNIRNYSNIQNITMVHDFKIDNKYSLSYQNILKEFSKKFNFKLITSPSSIKIPSQISATIAFKFGLKNINSQYFLFWEHDHTFTEKVDWKIINRCFLNGGRMLRFNRHINEINTKFRINKNNSYESVETSDICDFEKNLLRTNFYSNGPFIAEKDFCENLWSNTNYEYPSWNGFFGGFIEGPINQYMLAEVYFHV